MLQSSTFIKTIVRISPINSKNETYEIGEDKCVCTVCISNHVVIRVGRSQQLPSSFFFILHSSFFSTSNTNTISPCARTTQLILIKSSHYPQQSWVTATQTAAKHHQTTTTTAPPRAPGKLTTTPSPLCAVSLMKISRRFCSHLWDFRQ